MHRTLFPTGAKFLTLAALMLFPTLVPAASATETTFRGFYRVYLAGLKIGKFGINARFNETGYALSGLGLVSGIARIFSDSKGTAQSAGVIVDGRLLSNGYALSIDDDKGTSTVNIALASGNVTGVAHNPPEPPRPDRIPVEPAHLLGVSDPMSAFMGKPKLATGPGVCNRTISVFDGLQRFDIELSYARTVRVTAKEKTYSGPAYVCKVRFRPISGYRPGRKAIRYLQKSRDMEVWIAPLGNTGFFAPFRARVGTILGPAEAVAEDFFTESR